MLPHSNRPARRRPHRSEATWLSILLRTRTRRRHRRRTVSTVWGWRNGVREQAVETAELVRQVRCRLSGSRISRRQTGSPLLNEALCDLTRREPIGLVMTHQVVVELGGERREAGSSLVGCKGHPMPALPPRLGTIPKAWVLVDGAPTSPSRCPELPRLSPRQMINSRVSMPRQV